VGIIVGAPVSYPVYPHGHHAHIHDAHCPVIVHKHVDHHIYAAPVWDVHYAPLQAPGTATFMFLEISPGQAELYVNGHYLGYANSFHNGRIQIPVAPGMHTVQLQLHGTAYTKAVAVHPGRTAIVKARLL
jgi:hypothetical protein